jgi:hypothetical protein
MYPVQAVAFVLACLGCLVFGFLCAVGGLFEKGEEE